MTEQRHVSELSPEEALRELIASADAFEAESKRRGVWDEKDWGSTVIRAIQGYRPLVDKAVVTP